MVYMKMSHKSDIYYRVDTENAAGQKKPIWTLLYADQKCSYQPSFGSVRVEPTTEDWKTIFLYFPKTTSISPAHRVYNIRDRKGNVIQAGPYEIISVLIEPGFSGGTHHYKVLLKTVIE
jgi:hypothetical protein